MLFSAASDSCPSDLRSVGRFPTWTFGEGVEIVTTAEVLEQNKREKKKRNVIHFLYCRNNARFKLLLSLRLLQITVGILKKKKILSCLSKPATIIKSKNSVGKKMYTYCSVQLPKKFKFLSLAF